MTPTDCRSETRTDDHGSHSRGTRRPPRQPRRRGEGRRRLRAQLPAAAQARAAGHRRQQEARSSARRSSPTRARPRSAGRRGARRRAWAQSRSSIARKVGENGRAVRVGHRRPTSPRRSPAWASRSIGARSSCAEPIKELGEYDVPVQLHRDVTAQVKVHRRQGRVASREARSQSDSQHRGVVRADRHLVRVSECTLARSSALRLPGSLRWPIPFPPSVPSLPRACADPPPSRRTHAAAQPRGRALGARRASCSTTTRSTSPPRSSTPSDFFRDAHRRIFDKMVELVRARRRHRPGHAEGRARRGPASSRRSAAPPTSRALVDGVPRVDQRRALRADRQGEGDAPQPDLLARNKILADGLRRRRGRRRDPRPGRAARSSRSPTTRIRDGFVSLRDLAQEQLRHASRSCTQHKRPRHRRADRLHRSRRDDVGPAAVRPDHRRGAAVDGQDQLRAEHRAARRAPRAA